MEKKTNSRLMEMLGSTRGKVKVKEERVLRFLLENEDRLQELSIAEIAVNADVSKATVVRFCKSLDFNGLKDFKVWYEAGKGSRFTDIQPLSSAMESAEIVKSISTASSKGLETTFSSESAAVIPTIISDIREASSVIISGEGGGRPYSLALEDIIRRHYPEKIVYADPEADVDADLCIAFSFTGVEKRTIYNISKVVFAGGKADVVTTNPSSLIARAASSCLVLSNEKIYEGDPSMMGKIVLMGVLAYIDVALGKEE